MSNLKEVITKAQDVFEFCKYTNVRSERIRDITIKEVISLQVDYSKNNRDKFIRYLLDKQVNTNDFNFVGSRVEEEFDDIADKSILVENFIFEITKEY